MFLQVVKLLKPLCNVSNVMGVYSSASLMQLNLNDWWLKKAKSPCFKEMMGLSGSGPWDRNFLGCGRQLFFQRMQSL